MLFLNGMNYNTMLVVNGIVSCFCEWYNTMLLVNGIIVYTILVGNGMIVLIPCC